jgi:hypothetical protein
MTDRVGDPVGWLLDSIQNEGIEAVLGVFPGVYRAICVSNSDPENRGRIQFICPDIGQNGPAHVVDTLWALPVSTGLSAGTGSGSTDSQMKGLFFPPEEGDQIWVMFEKGDPSQPLYLGGWLRAEGTEDIKSEYLSGVDLRSGADAPVEKRGIRTKTGHTIVFDDSSESIVISRGSDGENPGDTVVIQENQVVVACANGDTLIVGDGTVTMIASDSSTVTVGDDAFVATNASGTTISSNGDGISMTANGDINIIAGGGINLNSGSVQLGKGPFESAVTGDAFAIAWQTHVHTTAVPGSPTSPTVAPPVTPGNGLSLGVKISK